MEKSRTHKNNPTHSSENPRSTRNTRYDRGFDRSAARGSTRTTRTVSVATGSGTGTSRRQGTTASGTSRRSTASRDRSYSHNNTGSYSNSRGTSSARANAEKRRVMEKRTRRHEWLEAFFEAGIIALILFFVLWPTKISGASMQETFYGGDRVVMSRIMVYLKWIQKNDIVICRASDQTNNNDIIKRIIGVPGDRITIIDGQVFLNNVLLYESYTNGKDTLGNIDRLLEKDEYFIMGDNREVSFDSRDIGPISRHDIIGKVVFRYYPLNKLKFY